MMGGRRYKPRPKGGAIVGILFLLLGLILGALALYGLRYFKIDPYEQALEAVGLAKEKKDKGDGGKASQVLAATSPEELKKMGEELKAAQKRLQKDAQDLALERRKLKQERELLGDDADSN